MSEAGTTRPQVNQVFVANNPTYTYVDRTKSRAATEFLTEITQQGVVIGLHGPSQSGKTVLCRHLLSDREPILLRGRPIKTMAHFWQAVKAGLNTPSSRQVEVESGNVRTGGRQQGANLSVSTPFISVGSNEQRTSASTASSRELQRETYHDDNEWSVMRDLTASNRPILLDDFHWMPEETVPDFLRTVKDLVFEGVTVVLIAIPEGAFKALKNDGELDGGRRLVLSAPIWKPSEIKSIAQKGFQTLGMLIDPAVIDDLFSASYRNPLLMQKLARALCIQLGVTQACEQPTPFKVTPGDFAALYRKIALEAFDPYEGVISEGERSWQLPNGKLLTLRQLICVAIHSININYPCGLSILGRRISRNFRITPSIQQLEQGIASMSDDFLKSREYRPPLRYDRSIQTLYVLEPDFRLALKWHLAETLGVH